MTLTIPAIHALRDTAQRLIDARVEDRTNHSMKTAEARAEAGLDFRDAADPEVILALCEMAARGVKEDAIATAARDYIKSRFAGDNRISFTFGKLCDVIAIPLPTERDV
jgi:hypothetical protein